MPGGVPLGMPPTKAKIVSCKDGKRKGAYSNIQFDFLEYRFRPRLVRRSRDNTLFWAFNPAVSARGDGSVAFPRQGRVRVTCPRETLQGRQPSTPGAGNSYRA
jgi:hypothetical protein